MNRWCLSALLVTVLVAVVWGAPKSLQDNIKILKKIDIETVLKNDRIIKGYIDCVTGKKGCTPEGAALKESWKEGIDKGCDDCDEEEKRKIKKVVKHIYLKHPDWYEEVANALDKDRKYRTKYQKYIDEIVADKTI
ncbi:unnamed protein product [Diabrotica balteata]|uniref:Uncharacterized protein n=1 Tax=Diabrotica balteata TaxID=107213 RepID=A0A9N9T7T7_DIABA|nr:unnamed protein product [Diabrotica balteata]